MQLQSKAVFPVVTHLVNKSLSMSKMLQCACSLCHEEEKPSEWPKKKKKSWKDSQLCVL